MQYMQYTVLVDISQRYISAVFLKIYSICCAMLVSSDYEWVRFEFAMDM